MQSAQPKLRPNVAMCVLNPQGEVLLVRHREHFVGAWQFPQGGVAPHTTLEQTVQKELREELGLITFRLLRLLKNVYQYHWPERLVKYGTDLEKRNYIGQLQSLAIIQVPIIRPVLKPDPREAVQTKWVPSDTLLKNLHHLRRPLGKLALLEIKKLALPRVAKVTKQNPPTRRHAIV